MRHQPFWVVLISLLLISYPSYAGKVLKTSGRKVYVVFSPEEEGTFGNNDIFYITDSTGKKTGIIQLKKVQGYKAIGVLGKGKAGKGSTTLFKGAGKSKKSKSSSVAQSSEDSSSESSSSSRRRSPKRNKMKSKWGVLLGYTSAKQDVEQIDISNVTTVSSQSGKSIGLRAAYHYPLSESLDLQFLGGFEMFEVNGTGKLPDQSGVEGSIGTKITYLTADALFRYEAFGVNSFGFKLVGGLGLYYPVTQTSTAIAELSAVAIGEFGVGLEYRSASITIPIDFLYYYFPAGGDVKTNMIGLRIGVLY